MDARHRRVQVLQAALGFIVTFEALATDWLQYHRSNWSSTHYERNEGLLRRILHPFIGKLPVDQVPATTLLRALRDAEGRGILESAHRARAVAAQVFAWAIATQRATNNPARDLEKALRSREVKHFDALPKEQLGDFFACLSSDETLDPVVKAALAMMLWTCLRDHELRAAKWGELGLKRLHTQLDSPSIVGA